MSPSPLHTTTVPSTVQEYKRFYDKLTSHNSLPPTNETTAVAAHVFTRDFIVDLSKIPTEIPGEKEGNRSQIKRMKQLFAFADVLTLSDSPEPTAIDFTGGGFLVVIGRTFCSNGPQTLTIDVNNMFTLLFCCYEPISQGHLTIILRHDDKTIFTYDLNSSAGAIGVQIDNMSGQKPTSRQLDRLDDSLFAGGANRPLSKFMRTQLRVSALTMFSDPLLSLAIGRFISGITFRSKRVAEIHFEASTILSQLHMYVTRSDAAVPLPSVTVEVYDDTLRALLETMKEYETQYTRFSVAEEHSGERKQDEEALLANTQDAINAQSRLLQQAKKSWEDAAIAITLAEQTTRDIENEVEKAQTKYFKALEQYAVDEAGKKASGFTVGKFCFQTGLSIASAMKGGFTAPVNEKLDNLEKLKKLADMADAFQKGYEELKKIPGNAMTVSKAVDGVNLTIAEAKANISQLDLSRSVDGDYASTLSKPDPEGLNAVAALEATEIAVVSSMKAALDAKIGGIDAYLATFKRLMTISKSVVRSKVAAAKAGQEYARALLQYQNMQNQKKRLEELQADTQNQLEIHAKQVDLFYDGLITIKTFVVLCLRSYADSYRFFSLQESAIVLDMQKSPVDLTRDFATLKQEMASYLSQHSSDPQPFSITTIYTNFDVEAMKNGQPFTVAYDEQDRGPFSGLSRVRLNGLRVWLDGARGDSALIKLAIASNGIYQDFASTDTTAKSFLFSAQPLKRLFWYEPGTNRIVTDAVIPSGTLLHNPPTPFSQWFISVQNADEVDLSDLTVVRVDWIGTHTV